MCVYASRGGLLSEFEHDFKLSSKKFQIGIWLAFVAGGIYFTMELFPEFSVVRTIFGGMFFGSFCALCALSSRPYFD